MENETIKINDSRKIDSRISETQKNLFYLLRNKKLKDWDTFSDPEYINLWKSVIEKYPETAHFIYELIQNADDALASNVFIFLYKDKLVFKHDGKRQFSLSDYRQRDSNIGDINSITSVACSTKKDEEQTIGKFGVGFKSVFQYTDVPSIYDDTFWFKIENYIIPTLLDSDHELRQEGETLFQIPFKNAEKAYSEILDRLQNLNMPTLFLPHVKNITWKIEETGEVHKYSKEILQSNERYGIKYELARIYDYKQDNLVYIFHRDYTTSQGIYDIGVGYFLNVDGTLDVQTKRNIYCFFPTSETFGSCFVSHAPFLLTDNRDRIKDFEDINKELLHGIEELAADTLLCLRDIGLCRNSRLQEENELKAVTINKSNLLLTDNLFKILSIETSIERNYDLKQCYLAKVKENNLILNRSGHYVSCSKVYSSTKELENLLSSAQIQLLCKDEEIDFVYLKQYRAEFNEESKRDLGISIFDNNSLAQNLASSFMEKQPIEWAHRLLTYIEENAIKLWKATEGDFVRECRKSNWGYSVDSWKELKFRFAPIVKTQEGEWVAPYTLYQKGANVCLPYKGFEDAGVDAFGKVIDKEFLQKHETFYRAVGLKKPNITDYVKKILLVHYENNIIPSDEVLLRDFKIIYKLLHEENNESLKTALLQCWKLRSKTDANLYKIEILYIPNEEFVCFINDNSTFKFVDCTFYSEGTGLSYRSYRKYSYQNFPQRVIDILDNEHLAVTLGPYFEDYQLEGYDIRNCAYGWSHALWKFLLKNEFQGKQIGTLTFFRYNEKRTYHKADVESTVLYNLKNDKWIVRQNGTFCSPSEITTEEFHSLGYEANRAIEQELYFLDKVQAEHIREEQLKKEEDEKSKRKDLLQQLNDINCPVEQLESFVSALKNGIDINKIIESPLSTNSLYEKNEDFAFADNSQSEKTGEILTVISSNLAPLSEIVSAIGEDDLPYVAENIGSFKDWLDEEDRMPSMVRRIVNYIGKKIYEQYLVNNGIEYEVLEDGKLYGDFHIENEKKYVSVISTLKTISDNKIPIGLTAAQNAFLRNHPDLQMRIVRISLKDIMVIPQYEHIVAIYGKEEEPDLNERLRKECNELAVNYWKGASIDEFDAFSPEYSIKIERKNGK